VGQRILEKRRWKIGQNWWERNGKVSTKKKGLHRERVLEEKRGSRLKKSPKRTNLGEKWKWNSIKQNPEEKEISKRRSLQRIKPRYSRE